MASGDTRILTPWPGKAERADRIILAAFAASGILPLALLPLIPALVSSHPALLELIRGSTASIINLLALAGWELGLAAVHVADLIAHYSLWVTIGLIVAITLWRSSRSPRRRRP